MTSAPLRVTRITSPDNAACDWQAWRELAGHAPMRLPEWLVGWWEQYRSVRDELALLLMHDVNNTLVGLAPLYIHSVGRRRIAKLLGSGDVCTDHTTWLSAPGREREVGESVARFLLDAPSLWNRIQLDAVDAADEAIRSTWSCLRENGCHVHATPTASCWRIPIPATWDEYLAQLSKTRRKRCRKLNRQFSDTGRAVVREVTGSKDFHRGWEVLLHLHAARWGSPTRPGGVFENPRFRVFHENVARQLLERQQLRLAWLEWDGRPIAVEYQFVDREQVYAYQSGIDPLEKDLQPGNLSMIASVHYAIEHGLKSIDLLRGDEPYKAHWRGQAIPCHDVRVWPGKLVGRLDETISACFRVAAGICRIHESASLGR